MLSDVYSMHYLRFAVRKTVIFPKRLWGGQNVRSGEQLEICLIRLLMIKCLQLLICELGEACRGGYYWEH